MSALRRLFAPSPKELIDRAIRRAAIAKADVEESSVRLRYYTVMLAAARPYEDWWRFAEIAECHARAQEDFVFYKQKAERIVAECDALLAEANKT